MLIESISYIIEVIYPSIVFTFVVVSPKDYYKALKSVFNLLITPWSEPSISSNDSTPYKLFISAFILTLVASISSPSPLNFDKYYRQVIAACLTFFIFSKSFPGSKSFSALKSNASNVFI